MPLNERNFLIGSPERLNTLAHMRHCRRIANLLILEKWSWLAILAIISFLREGRKDGEESSRHVTVQPQQIPL